MNSSKYFLFFILIACTGCLNSNSVDIFEGGCPENNEQAFAITDSDGITEMCLVTDMEQDVLSWAWSDDGSTFAFAVHDTSVTPPPTFEGSKYGNYVPPATDWYISNRDGSNLQRFFLADNKRLRFSSDGKYAVIRERCVELKCNYSVYEMKNLQKVCQYSVYTLWFQDSDCGNLTLKNGATWELKEEVNEGACRYYGDLGAEIEGCPQTRVPPKDTLLGTPDPWYPSPYGTPTSPYP